MKRLKLQNLGPQQPTDIYWARQNPEVPFENTEVKKVLVAQSCPSLCNPMDCSHQAPLPVGFSSKNTGVGCCHFFLKRSFWPRDRTWISCVSCIAGGFFTIWATREALKIWRRLRNSIAMIACKITLIWVAPRPWLTACCYGTKFLGQLSLPKAGPSGCVRPPSRPCYAPRKATENPDLPHKEVESGALSSVSVSLF